MFLKELNKELGGAYINLLVEFALVDNKIGKNEKKLIERALKELELEEEELDDIEHEEAIELIRAAGERTSNIVFFELTRAALTDTEYEMEEVGFLEELADKFNISRLKRFQMAKYFFKYLEYDEGNEEEAIREAEKIIN